MRLLSTPSSMVTKSSRYILTLCSERPVSLRDAVRDEFLAATRNLQLTIHGPPIGLRMIRQAGAAQPLRNLPTRHCPSLRKAQLKRGMSSNISVAKVQRFVIVPLSDRVRMSVVETC